MQYRIIVVAALIAAFAALVLDADADAAGPNLAVSAENPLFENHFAGSMVVEVVVRDASVGDTGTAEGEPDVTLNGRTLRMTQASDGSWYAYFANADAARRADSTAALPGHGLDFGVFCSGDTPQSVFGISLGDAEGFSVPSSSGLLGFTNGDARFSKCSGSLDGPGDLNNVVRRARSMNTSPEVATGQTGLDPHAWPLVQLFSFGDVTIQYRSGQNTQQTHLKYGDIPGISVSADRQAYPQNTDVYLRVADMQLNQDPTDRDSWTFVMESPGAVFYQAFAASGRGGAGGGPGLVDVGPRLGNLGFDDNGRLIVEPGEILGFRSTSEQDSSVSNGSSEFADLVTLVEGVPNSGIFDTGDHSNTSSVYTLDGAPRGRSGTVSYNGDSISILTGSAPRAAGPGQSLTINNSEPLVPGTRMPVHLVDVDQNRNSHKKDTLDAHAADRAIPTIRIGDPITLGGASEVRFHMDGSSSGMLAGSSVPDAASSRLVIDTSDIQDGPFERITLNLGAPGRAMSAIWNGGDSMTHWLNYDLRALVGGMGVSNLGAVSINMYPRSIDSKPIRLAAPGDITSAQGLLRLDMQDILDVAGTTFIEIDLADSGALLSPSHTVHAISLDILSFGYDGRLDINNSIYRLELEETGADSAEFAGTVEFAVAGQRGLLDAALLKSLRTSGDDVRLVISGGMAGKDGITVSYSEIGASEIRVTRSAQSDARTSTGTASLDSKTYRFGQPVTVILDDADLNLRHDRIDIYGVIDDPGSDGVDAVGSNGNILLEVLIKGARYQRCMVDGVEHGGLADTGFALVETEPDSGVFKGTFKMPTWICNKSGTKIISSAGGSIDVRYYDYADGSGSASTTSLSRGMPLADAFPPDEDGRLIPGWIRTAALSWSSSTEPDPGFLKEVWHLAAGEDADEIEMRAGQLRAPDWVRTSVGWWATGQISDGELLNMVQFLVKKGII